jgi:hypothetical protein
MTDKILIFAGAPETKALDWSSGGLLTEFEQTVAWLAGIDRSSQDLPPTSPASGHAAWRSLALDGAHFSTRVMHQHVVSFDRGRNDSVFGPSPEFLTTVSLSFSSDGDASDHSPALSQFYEHSMAAHQDVPSSQLISQSTGQATSYLGDTTTSFMSGDGSQSGSVKGPLLFRGSDLVCDLKNIPSAAYLLKIQPQTMTCNLVVGLISISPPRAVKTRWGTIKHLVELLVGDETKAGFAITYWLPSDDVAESPLAGLRPRDIVMVQNVALNVFTNRVYGSSLRKELTKVHLLYRMKLDSRDAGGYYSPADLMSSRHAHPQLEKTRRARDWVLNFVARGPLDTSDMDPGPRWNKPPDDDTQLI